MNVFAERLRYAMRKAEMTQTMLAKKSGCSKAAISQYLSGEHAPDINRVQTLADATGVSYDFLMGNEEIPTQKQFMRFSDVKITFVDACRCLRKSETAVREAMLKGCEYGMAVKGKGSRLNYIFYPGKFREVVGVERFNEFFGITT